MLFPRMFSHFLSWIITRPLWLSLSCTLRDTHLPQALDHLHSRAQECHLLLGISERSFQVGLESGSVVIQVLHDVLHALGLPGQKQGQKRENLFISFTRLYPDSITCVWKELQPSAKTGQVVIIQQDKCGHSPNPPSFKIKLHILSSCLSAAELNKWKLNVCSSVTSDLFGAKCTFQTLFLCF